MQMRNVGVVGCGLMGRGIAEVCALAGYRTFVREVSQELLDKGLTAIRSSIDRGVEKGRIEPEKRATVELAGSTDLQSLATCDLVIEEGTVSQVHLVFRQAPEGWTVEDPGSTNGSWLDGVRMEKAVPQRLAEGARIQAAQVLFTYASSSGLWRRLEAEALRH